jgi:2-(1,2-epoxy-1,2-dihydrophenyl)acetyl-CoA isomerase
VSDDTILLEQTGTVARLTLNRPHKLNSFTARMHEEIRDALDHLDVEIRTLVITGAGRAFCAGQDLHERVRGEGQDLDLGESIEKGFAPLVSRLRALQIPVVAAVNGTDAGAGANLAFACDVVVAATSAVFSEPFCALGLIPDTGGTYFLPRLIGTARAMGLTLLSGRVTAQEAEAWGLIWKCVDEAALGECVDEIVDRFAATPRLALAHAKRAIYASAGNSLDEQLHLERDALRELGRTPEYRAAVEAFLAKRKGSAAT